MTATVRPFSRERSASLSYQIVAIEISFVRRLVRLVRAVDRPDVFLVDDLVDVAEAPELSLQKRTKRLVRVRDDEEPAGPAFRSLLEEAAPERDALTPEKRLHA